MFTREDTSSLPVPETKFNGPEGERLGQLVVTPEVVAGQFHIGELTLLKKINLVPTG